MNKRNRVGLALFCILTGCAAPALGQSPNTVETLAARIGAINREVQAGPLSGTSQRLEGLLEERAALLSQLMSQDPAKALESAFPSSAAEALRLSRPGRALETRGRWEGTSEAVISDDFSGARSKTRWYLNTGQERVEMFFAGEMPRRPGLHVTVEGMRLRNRVAISGLVATASNTAAPLSCSTIGPQNIAVLMLTMPSNQAFPSAYTKASLQEAFFGSSTDTSNTQSLNGYWKEMSYGKTSATGQVFGPFALSQDYNYDTQDALKTAAINAADSTVDFTQFTRIALIFPIQSWGGWAANDTIGCATISSPSKGNLPASIGWLPAFPNSSPSTGLYAHELGHALGLNHSSSDDYGAAPIGPMDETGTLTEYGDPFAIMGGNAGHYAAQHKSQILHWLNLDDYQEATSSGSFTLRPLESTANPRGLRVLRDPLSSAWLWLEYRQPIGDVENELQSGYGNAPFEGALVHYEDPNLYSPWYTYLLDFNPVAVPNDFSQAALRPGSSWSDPYSPLRLSVGSPVNGGLPVSVSYDQPCASLQYSAVTFPASGGSGSITVSAPSGCAWSASSASSWISFPGSTFGSGNGTVSFSVASNSDSHQRDGYIAVQRQSKRIIERGTKWSVLSVSPSFGTGATGQFTFAFDDVNGYQDISYLWVNFSGSPACEVYAYPSQGELVLSGDPGGSSPPPVFLGTPGSTASNSVCSISSSGSSISGSGNQLLVTLQVNFLTSFGGAHRIEAEIVGYPSLTVPVGTWIVPSVQQPSVTIQASTAGAPFSLDGGSVYTAPATFFWSAGSQHTITWLSTSAGQPNARYAFQNWADGGANPRTITVPSGSTTYTASVKAQYQITVTDSPAAAGTVTASPASSDGYYDSATNVTLTAVPASGYNFWYFSGDVSGYSSPQTIVMSAPRNVVAKFGCNYQFSFALPSEIGPGPTMGFAQWQTGAGCSWSAASDSGWLGVGTPATGIGSGVFSFSVPPDTAAARSGTITFTGDSYNWPMALTQDGAGTARPAIVSATPSSGSGSTQVFQIQIHDPNGWNSVASAWITVDGISDSSRCSVYYTAGSPAALNLIGDDGNTWLGPLILPSPSVLQNSYCVLDGPHSAVSGSGNLLNLSLALTFKPAFAGGRRISGWAYDSTSALYSATEMVGSWTATGAQSVSVTIQSSTAGAPFSLEDGSVYQAPVTFSWVPGSRHTITWPSTSAGQPNARYAFQNWADGGANPRTITVPSTSATYTANIKAQYQLSLVVAPAGAGQLTAAPSSSDGYYDSGASVQIQATPAPGYNLWYFSGDASGSTNPVSVNVTTPLSVTGNFYCAFSNSSGLPYSTSSDSTAGLFDFSIGAGCAWTAASDSAWLTVSPASGTGSSTLQYAIATNAGAARAGAMTLTYNGIWKATNSVNQDAAGSPRASVKSLSPVSGAGLSTVATAQFSATGGYGQIAYATVSYYSTDSNSYCEAQFYHGSSGSNWIYLGDDLASSWASSSLPGSGTISVSRCSLNVSSLSISGSGNNLTVTLPLQFATAFAGKKRVLLEAGTSDSNGWSSNQQMGTWVVKTPSATQPQKIGTYNNGLWKLDTNGSGIFDAGVDKSFTWGSAGTMPVHGDWNGDGRQKAGFYVNGLWYLDYDGNGVWDNGVNDKVYGFGMAGAQPVVGDWNGDGKDEIGIYLNGFWFLDMNGNGVWDGEPTDKMIIWGWSGVTPVTGDWNGDGKKKVGLFYNGLWYLDYDGNGTWDGGVVDKVYGFGMSGVQPMVGDWNGDGKDEIGIYIGGFWFLDMNGNGVWDGETTDRMTILGWTGTTPVVGDWNGDGKTKVGTFLNGYWYLDYNGNGVWDGETTDKAYVFGQAGDAPVIGRW